ncbi:high affinity immunoglobulin alpha and immunoglobulin mu Fc receptor [Brachyistius frenatus]|uniref:high affinity immunoglobulin alpha and immunoglobulin mu Fc receptor n=1 Tax=Brachyistius frenatus TaxID=100188 RepID=UPI0037E966F0
MKPLCLLLFLLHASLQLQCDKKKVKSHIGGEFILVCNYDTKRFLFSKKYWCRGDRTTCEILVDSEGAANTKYTRRSRVVDERRQGLLVEVTNLQLDDTGLYWVGIDKIYADIMFSVNVVVTKGRNKTFVDYLGKMFPVSKPTVWPLSSLGGRPTCWGKPVTMRCGGAKGTGVQYAWYQRTPQKDFLLKSSSDLWLNCVTVESGGRYYCNASNDMSSEESDILSVQVLMHADSSCIYVIDIQDPT